MLRKINVQVSFDNSFIAKIYLISLKTMKIRSYMGFFERYLQIFEAIILQKMKINTKKIEK